MFKRLIKDNLVWFPEKGIGFYPVKDFVYDDDYYSNYLGYAETDMGAKLTKARIDLVARHYEGALVDVGIGAGQFVESRPNTYGYDVNPLGRKWLFERRIFRDFYLGSGFDALSFWDSLEHIEDIEKAIRQARRFVFVSMPIFKNDWHLVCSRHFRKDEHFWYFTHTGLINFFKYNGFELLEVNEQETIIGREDIKSFAFRRCANGR